MKKKQKINKAVNHGEWILLGLTALFLCVLFALRERPAPERGVAVRTASGRLPSGNASGNPGADSESASGVPDSGAGSASVVADADSVPDSGAANAGNASGSPDSVPTNAGNASAVHDSVSGSSDGAAYAVTPSDTPAVAPVTPSGNADERVNLNTADLQSLCALPGIGDALAGRILAYREERGPFTRPEDVMKVSGIGQGKFDAIKNLITV